LEKTAMIQIDPSHLRATTPQISQAPHHKDHQVTILGQEILQQEEAQPVKTDKQGVQASEV
jgi:hypothetical protein